MRIVKYGLELGEDMVGRLVKEDSKNCPSVSNDCLNSPQKIVDIMRTAFQLDKKSEEYVYLVALNSKCKPIGFFEVSHGTSNESFASPRSIYQRALLCGATNIILVHNHPSGCPEPSRADIRNAEQLKQAGELMEVNMLDSVIIAGDSYASLKELDFVF